MAVSIQTVRRELPPFRNEKVVIKEQQGTDDIINSILKNHAKYEADYDKIYPLFDQVDIYETCRGIWEFLKYNLTYNEETDGEQSVKSPSAILQPGEHIDCKHYSLFSGGVLDAIKRNEGDNWDWCYRFVTDRTGEIDPTHVFVVVQDKGRQIWIDPCLSQFDYHKKWLLNKDKKPVASIGKLYSISGVSDTPAPVKSVTANKDAAWVSFLLMVKENLFNVRDLLTQNPDVTTTALKSYCLAQGFDYQQLMNFINASK